MPRPRRIQVENTYYHIYNRFINGLFFFQNKKIVKQFYKIFFEVAELFNIYIIALVIMSNHFHAIIKLHETNLSRFLQRYSTKFAKILNKILNRKGHVFQGRHKTQIIYDEKHLLTSLGYVLYNPKRAGIVENIGDYEFSNFNDIVNPNNTNSAYDIIYNIFDPNNRTNGIKLFKEWVLNLDYNKNKEEIYKISNGQFLTNELEKEEILEKINRRKDFIDSTLKKRKEDKIKVNISPLKLDEIVEKLEISDEYWKGIWKTKSKFILHFKWYILREYTLISLKNIAYYYGNTSHQVITAAIHRIKTNNIKLQKINLLIREINNII